MSRRVRVHGIRREFDVERYAAVVIALAKHLVATEAGNAEQTAVPALPAEDNDDES